MIDMQVRKVVEKGMADGLTPVQIQDRLREEGRHVKYLRLAQIIFTLSEERDVRGCYVDVLA